MLCRSVEEYEHLDVASKPGVIGYIPTTVKMEALGPSGRLDWARICNVKRVMQLFLNTGEAFRARDFRSRDLSLS